MHRRRPGLPSREVQSRLGADRRRPFQGSRGGAARVDCRRARNGRGPHLSRRGARPPGTAARSPRASPRGRDALARRAPRPSNATWRRSSRMGRVEEGLPLARPGALHLDPDSISAHQLAAFALLAHGYLARGLGGVRLPAGVLRVSRAVSRRGRHARTAVRSRRQAHLSAAGAGSWRRDFFSALRAAAESRRRPCHAISRAPRSRVFSGVSRAWTRCCRRVGAATDGGHDHARRRSAACAVPLSGNCTAARERAPAETRASPPAFRIGYRCSGRRSLRALSHTAARRRGSWRCANASRRAGNPPYIGLTWRGGTPPERQRDGRYVAAVQGDRHRALGSALRDIAGTFVALQRKPEPAARSRPCPDTRPRRCTISPT